MVIRDDLAEIGCSSDQPTSVSSVAKGLVRLRKLVLNHKHTTRPRKSIGFKFKLRMLYQQCDTRRTDCYALRLPGQTEAHRAHIRARRTGCMHPPSGRYIVPNKQTTRATTCTSAHGAHHLRDGRDVCILHPARTSCQKVTRRRIPIRPEASRPAILLGYSTMGS